MITFSPVPGLSRSTWRGIGFLEGNAQLNANEAFCSFQMTEKNRVRAYMDEWIAGKNGPKTRFHGFDVADYRDCFVFKDRQKRVHQRLYGFLCHPDPNNPRFQLCVLCIHATKTERETDKSELDRVNQWRVNGAAREAIAAIYRDYQKGGIRQCRT